MGTIPTCVTFRVADFALSWRGKHDEVIRGYEEVTPLEDAERALITPVWWARLLMCARWDLQSERSHISSWVMNHIARRTPLMTSG